MARPKGSKVPKGSDNPPVKARISKVKLSLSAETLRLLRLEAFGRGISVGQVVDDLVAATPRRFVLVDRGSRGAAASPALESSAPSEAPGAPATPRPLGILSDVG